MIFLCSNTTNILKNHNSKTKNDSGLKLGMDILFINLHNICKHQIRRSVPLTLFPMRGMEISVTLIPSVFYKLRKNSWCYNTESLWLLVLMNLTRFWSVLGVLHVSFIFIDAHVIIINFEIPIFRIWNFLFFLSKYPNVNF